VTRYWAVVGVVLASFLAGFALVEALQLSVLSDPSDALRPGGAAAAALALALLVLDAVLPVPSSIVMIALGALYGPLLGMLLSLLGRLGMTLVGFAAGRRGGPLLARLVPPDGRARADAVLARWGALAIVLSRPVPLLAETVTVLAGASSIGWGRAMLASLVGSAPEAAVYALAGAVAREPGRPAAVWAAVCIVAGGYWLIGRGADRRLPAGPRDGARGRRAPVSPERR
jgi:uncharacterized membrane protein YdjX (TVP38/TMEM64 family)